MFWEIKKKKKKKKNLKMFRKKKKKKKKKDQGPGAFQKFIFVVKKSLDL